VALVAGLLYLQAAMANGMQVSTVNAVDLTGSEVTMLGQQQADSPGCRVLQYGRVDRDGLLQIGDSVKHAGRTIQVGIIELNRFTRDLIQGGRTLMHKGDQLCLVAGSRDALPHEGSCDALWLRVNPCRVLE
jgi:hypothetical protein